MSRPHSKTDALWIRFDEFELDEGNARLLHQGKVVALAPTPFNLLCALARQPGALLAKDALLDAVWGHQFVSESVLKTAISDLRMALGDAPRAPRFIETVSRRGYRFIAESMPARAAEPVAPAQFAGASLPFVGRADASAKLRRAWEQAAQGRRAVVWVAGEPGIGKSTLIEHFAATVGVCARGQCVEHYGAGEPYLPILEALADLCRHDTALPKRMRSIAPTWLLQLPWLSSAEERDALRRELAGVGPDRMLREMGELLEQYTQERPLLLVTEDLHWSDRATIQLIDHVARRRGRARLMWLASFRVAEVVAPDHPLNALRRELRLHRLCEEIALDAFSEAEVAEYVAQHAAALAGDAAFAKALHARTDGVPLFISSVITEVLEGAEDGAAAQARLAAAGVPENLAAIIDHYIAGLSDEQRALLAAAAVCGVHFRAETLAFALARDVSTVALACDALVRGQVWLLALHVTDDGDASTLSYSFRHALFRQVLHDRTPPSVRLQLHREVGVALERERAAGVAVAAAELAMHFDRGHEPMAALKYYAEAAEGALLNFSPATCASLTERGLALLRQAPASAERSVLEFSLATLRGVAAFHTHGVGTEATHAFERAYTLLASVPEHPRRNGLLHGFGYLLSLRGDYARALVVAQQAQTLSAASSDPVPMLIACLLRGQVHLLEGRTQAARTWIERGLAVAEPLDMGPGEVFAADPQVTLHGMLAIELARCGQVAQARAHAQRAQARARQLRQPMTRLVAAWQEALFEVHLGNVDRLAILVEEMQALVDEFSLVQGRTACKWFRGWTLTHQGRPQEGLALIRAAYDDNLQLGMRAGASEVLGYAADALLRTGDFDAARALLVEAMQTADEMGERMYVPQLLLLDAAIARAQGRADDARAATRRAIEEAQQQQAPWLELEARVDFCEYDAATASERAALAALVDGLPQAGDTPLIQRARALLQTS